MGERAIGCASKLALSVSVDRVVKAIRVVDVGGVRFGYVIRDPTLTLPRRISVWEGAVLRGSWEMIEDRIGPKLHGAGVRGARSSSMFGWRSFPRIVKEAIERDMVQK